MRITKIMRGGGGLMGGWWWWARVEWEGGREGGMGGCGGVPIIRGVKRQSASEELKGGDAE